MVVEALLIINKSGGLIYHKNFAKDNSNTTLNSNDYLILASTLHSVFAISSQITPKALQISHSNINYNIPYYPYVGVNKTSGNSTNNNKKFGSFKGDDYFKEPFSSWNKSGLRQLTTDKFTLYLYQTMTGLKFIVISNNVPMLSQSTSSKINNNKSNLPNNKSNNTYGGSKNGNIASNPITSNLYNVGAQINKNINSMDINNTNQYNIGSQIADNLLRKAYCIYSDYVMKDPFYSLEMPIKSELFDSKITELIGNL